MMSLIRGRDDSILVRRASWCRVAALSAAVGHGSVPVRIDGGRLPYVRNNCAAINDVHIERGQPRPD